MINNAESILFSGSSGSKFKHRGVLPSPPLSLSGKLVIRVYSVVGVYINIMNTSFDLNFDLYQAFKQHAYTKSWKQREAVY